jgi:hypothetical protein
MSNTVVDLQLYLEYQTEVLVTADIILGLVRFVAVTCPGTAMLGGREGCIRAVQSLHYSGEGLLRGGQGRGMGRGDTDWGGVEFARTSRVAHGTVRIQRTTWKKNTSIVNGNSVIIK